MATLEVQWRRVAHNNPLSPRQGHSLTRFDTTAGLSIYAIGGNADDHAPDPIQVIDNHLMEWKEFKSTNSENFDYNSINRRHHTTSVVNDKLYVIGGTNNDQTLSEILQLDTKNQIWSKIDNSGHSTLSSHTANAIGNKIYIIGQSERDPSLLGVKIFDAENKKWISPKVLGKNPSTRYYHTSEVINNNRILIFGGQDKKTQCLNDIWFLEFDTPFVRHQREAHGEDVVCWSKGMLNFFPKPIVICGPSGVGKGTLINKLMDEYSDNFGFSVSHTTRAPRVGEVNGVHYHFTDRESMLKEIKEEKFLESADVHGNLYGTSIRAVKSVVQSGKMCVLDIDVQGAEQVKRSKMEAIFIFVSPPSYEELEKRLRGRGTETEEQIKKRLKNAKKEMEKGTDSDLFDHIIVNDSLDHAYERLKAILGLISEDSVGQESYVGPSSRYGHCSVMLDSKLLIHGGITDKKVILDDVHVLETKGLIGGGLGLTCGLKWSSTEQKPTSFISSLLGYIGFGDSIVSPTPRYNHKAVALNDNEAFVCGGYCAITNKAINDSLVITLS